MAGQTPLWGTDASAPSGTTVAAIHANAFSLSFAQGSTGYFGFGDVWMRNHGTICSWAGSIGGFTTSGVTGNTLFTKLLDSNASPDLNTVATNTQRSGEAWTFTWKTGCTVIGTIIFTGVNPSVNFLGTDSTGLNFIGDLGPAETWAVS